VGPGAPRATRIPAPEKRFDQPHWVMLRSLVIPGWGQFHNHAWFKAALVASADLTTRVGILRDEHALPQLRQVALDALAAQDEAAYTAAADAYNTRLDASINRRWLLAGILVYSLLDAYVDAHFLHFDTDFHSDPALPEGTPAPAKARLYVEWTF
jgi:hypothetical protein